MGSTTTGASLTKNGQENTQDKKFAKAVKLAEELNEAIEDKKVAPTKL